MIMEAAPNWWLGLAALAAMRLTTSLALTELNGRWIWPQSRRRLAEVQRSRSSYSPRSWQSEMWLSAATRSICADKPPNRRRVDERLAG